QLERAAEIISRLVEWLVMQRFEFGVVVTPGPVSRHSRDTNLYPNITEALSHKAFRALNHGLEVRAICMGVRIDGLPAFTAGKLIHRHTSLPALDIPQCLIHTAQRIVQHRAVLPVRTVVTGLPDIFDPVSGLAHKK